MSTVEDRRRWFRNFVEHVQPEGRWVNDIDYDEKAEVITGKHWERWAFVVEEKALEDREFEQADEHEIGGVYEDLEETDEECTNEIMRYCVIVQNDSHSSTYPLFDASLEDLSRTLATLTDSGDCMDEAFPLGCWDLEDGMSLQPYERHYFTFKRTEDDKRRFAQQDLSVPDLALAAWAQQEAEGQHFLAQDFAQSGATEAARLCQERALKLVAIAKALGGEG